VKTDNTQFKKLMRKIIITSLVLVGLLVVQCGSGPKKDTGNTSLPSSDTGTAQITFREYEHNFGKVTEGEKVAYVFTFENKGTANLVVTSATTSCGCTVPKYDTKPIPPGENGNLEVVFDTSGKNGMQTKTITVKSNASTPVVLLKITAEVVTNNN
jgi:hypothetical protein